jgi:hypothetical protein
MALTREQRIENLAKAREARAQRREDEKRLERGLIDGTFIDDGDDLDDPTVALEMADHKWLGEPGKSFYIPSWYKPHKKNLWVTHEGKSLGFKINQVMAYRRWSIYPNGELMDQRDFEPLYEKYIAEISPKGVEARLQHIPRVEDYVDAKPDPSGGPGLVAINFDPDKPPAKPDDGMRYDPIKDVIFSLKEDMDRTRLLERKAVLADMLSKGDITGEVFEREMRSLAPKIEIGAAPQG